MKPYTIPMILLVLAVLVLAGGLIYYINLNFQESVEETSETGGTSETGSSGTPASAGAFSCKKAAYENTDECLFPDLQIKEVEMESKLKTGLPHKIIVSVYNAGLDTDEGYEVKEFYFDPSTKLRVDIGGSSVSGVHNSGGTKEITITWVPKITGRYRYIIKLDKLDEAGVPGVILEKGLTEWARFVKVSESDMACLSELLQNDIIKIIYDKEKCVIEKDGDLIGRSGGKVELETVGKITIINEKMVKFDRYQTFKGRQIAYFLIDGEEVETGLANVGDTVTLEHDDLTCSVELLGINSVKINNSPKCAIIKDEDIKGRTDYLKDEGWTQTLNEDWVIKEIELQEDQYTVINQEVVKYVNVVKDITFETFCPIMNVNGDVIEGNTVGYNSISVFGK